MTPPVFQLVLYKPLFDYVILSATGNEMGKKMKFGW